MRRTVLQCLLVAAPWFAGCAPLNPAPSQGPALTSPEAPATAPSALEQYRQQRSRGDEDGGEFRRPWIAVLPFADESGFRKGVWDIENEMPRMLSVEMERSASWRVVPYEAVAEVIGQGPRPWADEDLRRIGQALACELLVRGTLLDYNMERLHVGDPMVGGYKSYKGVAEIELQVVRPADLEIVGTASAQQETTDRGLGLDLLGKPREQDYQFVNLGRMPFGSAEFRATAIGQATVAAMEEVIHKVSELVRPRGLTIASGIPEILSVFGEEVFINLGSENGVHRGYRFAVYAGPERPQGVAPSERLAVVEVLDIIGARVSKVTVLSGAGQIAVGDRLELIEAKPE